MQTLVKLLDRIPPFLCVALSRVKPHGPRLTLEQISERSGLSMWRVKDIAKRQSWSAVSAFEIQQFSSACGVDLMRPCLHLRYLRQTSKCKTPFKRLTTQQRKHLANHC